jgi:hypothetical protein
MMKRLIRGQVVSGLRDAAKDHGLELSEAAAGAIFEELETSEIMTLKSSSNDDEKLTILGAATQQAIARTKDAAVRDELQGLVTAVEAAKGQ